MIRKATHDDIEAIMGIVRSAQLALCELGIDQWQDGYPRSENIAEDISQGVGYVVANGNAILAYAAIILTGEPAYEQIANKWQTDERYVVVHRLCVDSVARRQGIALQLMQHAAHLARRAGYSAFRIDTQIQKKFTARFSPESGGNSRNSNLNAYIMRRFHPPQPKLCI